MMQRRNIPGLLALTQGIELGQFHGFIALPQGSLHSG